ncbi:xylose ABC transporter permease [Bifidobacterium minimum]|uniref:Xylose transport system permease protein XylH n=1 Tax=Bifidobacterium minimum TaxID=1693 RepID=A0A087BNS5_9BIFI|nr:sugar ABC transporter permease [Bifidobacterium minimum]KFI72675.1 xylose ABC transporter permease [Bifidobacterium minimum]
MSAAITTSHVERKTTSVLGAVANNARQYGIVGALLVIVVAFEILTKGVLLKPNSFVSLIQQNAYVIILAIGMVMVIIATHIDLSVGSLVAFIGGVCALLMERQGVNWMLAIAIAAAVILFVTYLLASSGNADQGGIPIMLVIVAVLVLIYNFILTRTVFGRHVYAVGGNRKAAILSGINTRRVDFTLFIHMGFLSAVAAVCMLSRLASATAQAGMEFEMDAIAACFIGGTAVTGGIGTIPGAIVGAFVMGVINQGLSIMGVDTAIVKTIKGLVLLLAVAVDIMSKRKKS